MRIKNYFELSSIQGELEGLAMGMEATADFNHKGLVQSLKELAIKVKNIQETENYE